MTKLPPLRRSAALLAGRAAGFASRALRRGGGTALPGLVAEALDPGLVADLASRLGGGSLIVTGTNGKTTTARMIAGIASTAGLQPLPNRSGSNLMRGIATALMDEADLRGRVRDGARRLGVFEVDEATLPAGGGGRATPPAALHQPLPRSAGPLRRGGLGGGLLAPHPGEH